MKTLYEELIEKGLSAKNLPLDLAWTIPYHYKTDQVIGLDIITYKPVQFREN